MTWEFDQAPDGNVALTGQLDIKHERKFTVAISFGETLSSATACLLQSLSGDFKTQRRNFVASWEDAGRHRKSLEGASGDKGRLFHSSYNIVLAHEDKTYQGAFIASVANPWGEARNDEEGKGGYHLVWTRDMVQSAMGLLAAGDADAPARVLVYLAARQEEDGSFPQNFWVDGKAFLQGEQLDEVAFPVLLAWRLHAGEVGSRFDCSHAGAPGREFPAPQRTRHRRRALGGGKWLFTVHAGGDYLRLHLRGCLRTGGRKARNRRPS